MGIDNKKVRVKKYKNYILYAVSLLMVLVIESSCTKTSIDDIPSYLQIDTASIIASGLQGTSSHKITDIWVYSGNEYLGTYELPAKFPILKSGKTDFRFYAGIKMNGINETRVAYDFLKIITQNVKLQHDSVSVVHHLKFTYADNVVFAWAENFEQYNLSLDSTSRSEVNFSRVALPELATVFPYELNEYAAKVVITDETSLFECQSHDALKLPNNGKQAFLELNYKSNNHFTVGIVAIGAVEKQHAILGVNPSKTWNKIYINLTSALSSNSDASKFRIFFTASKTTDEPQAEIYLDNIKVIHSPF